VPGNISERLAIEVPRCTHVSCDAMASGELPPKERYGREVVEKILRSSSIKPCNDVEGFIERLSGLKVTGLNSLGRAVEHDGRLALNVLEAIGVIPVALEGKDARSARFKKTETGSKRLPYGLQVRRVSMNRDGAVQNAFQVAPSRLAPILLR
jgi:hypothetical protein